MNQEAAFRGSHLVTCYTRLGRPQQPTEPRSYWPRRDKHLITSVSRHAVAQMLTYPVRITTPHCKAKVQLGSVTYIFSSGTNRSVSENRILHL